ncbi:hypothetical protein AMATHDRAFT_45858 [Amanita thiersii Skay4041]|uniref:Uncharacterized protein n=1 Tax=Amanita thiersii Skay4041 TaxID=703135 RepID=A0A2A9NYD6_9AGAR|nr:hypothetical protein AMATHDRAFT_45858 [Amanita thiersii Skay4041]
MDTDHNTGTEAIPAVSLVSEQSESETGATHAQGGDLESSVKHDSASPAPTPTISATSNENVNRVTVMHTNGSPISLDPIELFTSTQNTSTVQDYQKEGTELFLVQQQSPSQIARDLGNTQESRIVPSTSVSPSPTSRSPVIPQSPIPPVVITHHSDEGMAPIYVVPPPAPVYTYHDAASPSSSRVFYPYHTSGSHALPTKRPSRTQEGPTHWQPLRSHEGTTTYSQASEQPYTPVNPYQASVAYSLGHASTSVLNMSGDVIAHSRARADLFAYIFAFIFDTVPRQIYLHLLLRLPSLYFSRVSRIFEEADLSVPELVRLAQVAIGQEKRYRGSFSALEVTALTKEPTYPSSPFWNLKVTWEAFIDSLLREWKTLNIISALLLSYAHFLFGFFYSLYHLAPF